MATKNHPNIAVVGSLPTCNFCPTESATPAIVDGSTRGGPWAFMCLSHYLTHGIGLGLGRGQMLVVEGDVQNLNIEVSA